jgi:hypothetical protein
MSGMKEKEGSPGVQVGRSADQESTGQEKKITPFLVRQTGLQPCMSFMPACMSGNKDPRSSAVQATSPDVLRRAMGEFRRERMTQEDREMFYSLVALARENAITCLDTLVRYDECLTMKEAEYLQHCAGIIQCAEVIQP